MKTELGKISRVKFGIGGYQDAMLGIFFTFEGKGWGVGSHQCAWDAQLIEHTKHCQWTEADRSKQYDEIMRFVSKTLSEAKVQDVKDLVGIPVEVTFESNTIKSWRILTEVL